VKFTLITFNVGLLGFLRGFYQPVPFVEQRLQALPHNLLNMNADVIALQEIYRQSHRRYLVSATREVFPFSSQVQTASLVGLGNGLMTLSKFMMSSDLESFRSALPDERLFDNKGVLVSRLRLSGETEVLLLNIHMTAGGSLFHPESPKANRIRAKQIAQVLNRANSETDAVVILAGDLNAGPGVSEDNYRQFCMAGFVSVHDSVNKSSVEVTWDPTISLNRSGRHRTSPPQRVDHVFVRQQDVAAGRIQPLESTIQSKEEVVVTPDGQRVTLSDHFSIRVLFSLT
jgi:endonuclease/exonuclease/phosphatase family metal-dependent hydrolase